MAPFSSNSAKKVLKVLLFCVLTPQNSLHARGNDGGALSLVLGSFAAGAFVFGVGEIARSSDQRSNFWPVYVNTNASILGIGLLGVLAREMFANSDNRGRYDAVIVTIAFGVGFIVGGYTYHMNLHDVGSAGPDIYVRLAQYTL